MAPDRHNPGDTGARWLEGPRLAMVLLLVVGAAHGVTLDVPFQFDDIHQIGNNAALRDPASAVRFFTDPWLCSARGDVSCYRPLLFLTFLVDGLLGDGSALPYRVTSLLLLAAYAWVVTRFTRVALERWLPDIDAPTRTAAAAIAGLVAAAHPLLDESLLMATSRSSLMMGLFGVTALGAVIGQPTRPLRQALCAGGFTLLALLTKETAVSLAPLAVLISLTGSGPWSSRIRPALAVVIPVAVYVLFHFTLFKQLEGAGPPVPFPDTMSVAGDRLTYPGIGGLAMARFIGWFFVPWGLSPVHALPATVAVNVAAGYAVWPAGAAAGVMMLRRGPTLVRAWGGALLWAMVAMAPVLVLVPLNTPFAEHRVVAALAGPLAATGLTLATLRFVDGRRIALVVVLVGSLAVASTAQSLPWRQPVSLWQRATRLAPEAPRGWGMLADTLYEANRFAEARRAVRRALALEPAHPIYLLRAAAIEIALGDLQAAATYTRRGLAVESKLPELHLVEAERLALTGATTLAERHARAAVALDPRSNVAWNALGNTLYMLGRRAEAADAYRAALERAPDDAIARRNLERLR